MTSPARFVFVLSMVVAPAWGGAQTLVGIPNGPNLALPDDPLNEDKAVFNVSTFDYWRGRAFYFSAQNNRILVNFQKGDGTWEFPTSQVAVELPETPANSSITIALGVVVASATADFKNAWDELYYQRLMYFIHQSATTPGSAGRPCVAFSNDGVTWARPAISVGPPGQAATRCQNGLTSINLEAIAGYRSGDQLVLVGLEGDLSLLTAHGPAVPPRTLTYAYAASRHSPHAMTKVAELSAAGMFAPAPAAIGATSDYYFRNLDFTYEPATGKAWIARATPYPYKFYAGPRPPDAIPCSGVCPTGLPEFPMRGQVYWLQTNGNLGALATGTWTLARDFGRSTGWQAVSGGACGPRYPLVSPQQKTFGVDMDSVSLHKATNGTLARDAAGNVIVYVGSYLDRQQSCNSAAGPGYTFLDGALYTATFPF